MSNESISCSTTRAMLLVASLAAMLYGTRFLYSLLQITCKSRPKLLAKDDVEVVAQRGLEGPMLEVPSYDVDKVYKEALSPVLAFFPE
jgi:hypothetical protein